MKYMKCNFNPHFLTLEGGREEGQKEWETPIICN